MKNKYVAFYLVFIGFFCSILNLNAQVSTYVFAASSGTFVPITGGTVLGTGTGVDDVLYPTITLPFSFNYNGAARTGVKVNSNGWITFNTAATSGNAYSVISSTTANVNQCIGGFSRDLAGTATGVLRYETVGTAPNRTFVVQWVNFAQWNGASSLTFQIRLNEQGGVAGNQNVQVVYGTFNPNATLTGQVGLKGDSNADFNNRTSTTTWAGATAAATNAATMTGSTTIKPASGLTYTWTPPNLPACIGTPAPGNTLSSLGTMGCNGSAITLSLQNQTTLNAQANLSYQWETSPDGITWSNAAGVSTNKTYVSTLAATTYYRCNVTCSNGGAVGTSTPITVTINPFYLCYCANIPSNASEEEIFNVTIGTLNNTSNCADVSPGAGSILNRYGNYGSVAPVGALTTTVTRLTNTPISLNLGLCAVGSYNAAAKVYIDNNRDGDYSDAGEMVYATPDHTSSAAGQVFNGTINLPYTGVETDGLTGMRVVYFETTSASITSACTVAASYGEVEDYVITIASPIVCSGTPATSNALANSATVCSGVNFNLSLSTTYSGLGFSYQWQSSPNNTIFTPISGATSSTLTTSQTSASYYRCVTSCSFSGASTTSYSVLVGFQDLPTFDPIPAICFGNLAPALPTTSKNGISGTWNPEVINTSQVGLSNYTFTPNIGQCATTTTISITVISLPTATISANGATSFCSGGNVILTANTGSGYSYQWKLNGASITGATSVNYTAFATGSYTVVISTGGNCSATSNAISVSLTTAPTATISTVGSTSFCTGGSVVLNANTGTGLSYQWKLNGSNISGATAVSYSASASGSYTVLVTNSSACSTSSSATTVTVNVLPSATITAASSTSFCSGGSVVLNANTGTGLSYQWKLNGTNISGATAASYTASASGSYTILVTNSNGCSATSSATNVTVTVLPSAIITASGPTSFCTGGSVVLNANTGAGYTYQWKLNGSNISGATAVSYSASAAGSYTVTITNGACSATSSGTVVSISAGTTATISNTTPLTFCAGSSVVLNANTGTGFTYQWKLNSANISGATAASYTASASGSYTVTVSLSGGCASTSTAKVVTVNPLPIVSSTVTPVSGNTCTGGSATLSGTGAVSYVWSGGVTNNVSFVPTSSTTYTVTGTDANGCVNTATRSITVNAIPTITGTITGPTMICGLTTATYSIAAVAGATSYTWTLPTGITGTSSTNSITVAINTSLFTTGNIGVRANSTYCTSALRTLTVAKIPATPTTLTGTTVTCGITSATYTASASTGATSYTWALPTGFTGSSTTTTLLASINNTLFTTGNVSVIANNSCGSSTAKTLAVSKVPFTPGTISGPTITCGLTTATYSITTVTGATSYTWSLPTGITGTSTTNSIVVSINNTLFTGGNISVIANNACGSSPAKTLAVSKFLATPGTISGPSLICGLTTGTYSVTAISGATSYTWNLPAGLTGTSTTNSITASINPALFTSGNVTVTANNACGASPVKTLTLTKIPASPTTLSGSSFICGLTSTTYTATAVTGATSYTWTLPAGLTGTSNTNTITVAVNPALFVSGSIGVTANNACGSSTIKTLALTKIPTTPTTITGLATGVCAGSTQTYSCTAMANSSSYTWSVPAGSVINSGQGTASINVTFPTPFTSGTISVTANSACGSSTAKTLSIRSTPTTPGAITGQSSNLCGGGTFSYSITAVSGATGYNWVVPAGCTIASGANTNAITMSVPSSFASGNISVSSSNACGAGTPATLALTAVPSTFATITGPASACANQAGLVFSTTPVFGSSQFTWTVPSGAIITSGQGTANITVTWGAAAGSVSVVAFNACGTGLSKTKSLTLAACRLGDEISLEETALDNSWSLFPNPTLDKVNIHFTEFDSSKKYNLTVTNALGQLVYNSSINQQTTIIELQSFAKPGMYFVHLINGQNNVMETKKLIVN